MVDAELRTVVAKESGYNLLNPDIPRKRVAPLSPPQQRRKIVSEIKLAHHEMKAAQLKVHNELLELFKENPERFDFEEYTSKPANVIGMIRNRIEQLAGEQILRALDAKYKETFRDRFPRDIPHAKDLPTDVYHNIDVKPGLPVSVGRAYSCPRKYREGWKTLIDQHVAAGRIRTFRVALVHYS